MTATKAGTVPTVAAPGAGDHVKGTGTHTHDVDVSADIAAAIAAHVAKDHATTPPVTPPVTPPTDAKPTISGVAVTEATQTSVRIGWQLSEPCTGQVEYGGTATYGKFSALESGLLLSHSQVLSGLTANTIYHFRIHSVDSAGQSVYSNDASFQTSLGTVVTPPPSGGSTRVTSVAALMSALLDNTLGEIILANGTHSVSSAANQDSNSLYIGNQFASRTRPVLIRPDTPYGVTFDGGGSANGILAFQNGSHDQTWDGFVLANCMITQTGVVTTGGWAGQAGCHHITLRNIRILSSCRGAGTNHDGSVTNHAFYGSMAVGGPHDWLLENWDIDCGTTLDSGFHFYHGDSGNPCCWNFTIRNFTIKTAEKALIIWEPSCHDILFDTGTITNSTDYALSYNHPASKIVMRNVKSTGSGTAGVEDYGNRSGLTIESTCSFN